MKKIITLVILISFQWVHAVEKDSLLYANSFKKYYLLLEEEEDCDACGCSANGGSMGFSSMFNNSFVGVRYVYQSYTSKEGIFKDSPWIDENFNSIQIWSRIPVSKRIQILALLPYHSNNRELLSGKETISGIGDAMLMGMYSAYQTKVFGTTYTHKLQVGGGVKFPTGKYSQENNGTLNPSFQLGTGSVDYLLVTEYVLKRKQLGLNTFMNYTFKTENSAYYQFGNQFNYGSTLFYLWELNALSVVPQVGVSGEVYASNKQFQQDVLGTKGDVFFGKLGVELGKNNFSLGVNTMLPIQQNLTGGNVKSNYRFSVNLNYSL